MWMNKGMIRIKDVYEDNILQSFESLVVKFHIPQKHLFKYLQLRSFITTCLKGSTQLPHCQYWRIVHCKTATAKGG